MDLGLKGKTAVVTASSSGLGKGIAAEFAREGANVMLFSPSGEKLLAAQAEIERETGNRPSFFVGSITDVDDVKALFDKTERELGPVYALVNNTGGPPAGRFDDFEDLAWQDAFELTLLSYVRTIRTVLPSMRAHGGGRIVNSTSSSVKSVLDNLILSNTFRTGVMGLTKSLSQELGKDGILINVIGPGRIGTARIDHLDSIRAEKSGMPVDEVRKKAFETIPIGRYGTIDEYGRLAVFLCSEANTYITGQTIILDGGMVKAY